MVLYAKAQHDLLVYIEKERADHQVIYTTHSPFMIDPERLLRARTVEDVYVVATEENGLEEDQDLGTKVGDEILSLDSSDDEQLLDDVRYGTLLKSARRRPHTGHRRARYYVPTGTRYRGIISSGPCTADRRPS